LGATVLSCESGFSAVANLFARNMSTPTRDMMTSSQHAYEVRPRKGRRGFDLTSDVLPFGRLWYDGPNAVANAIGYAEHYSRSHHAVIRVYDDAGMVIRTHEHRGDFKEW
jgi:hypothetical protein